MTTRVMLLRAAYVITLLVAFLLGFAVASLIISLAEKLTSVSWLSDARFASALAAGIGGLRAAWATYRLAKRSDLPLGLK